MRIVGKIYWGNKDFIKARRLENIDAGHDTITCGICGDVIRGITRSRYAYKRGTGMKNGGREIFFCSYHCMRQYDREKESKARTAKALAKRSITEIAETDILRRIKVCEGKLKYYREQYYKVETDKEKKVLSRAAVDWQGKLAAAQNELEVWRKENGDKEQRTAELFERLAHKK